MEIVNNPVSGVCTNEYKSKNMAKQTDEYSMKMETPKSNDRILGIGTLGDKKKAIFVMECGRSMQKITQRLILLLKW